jgi:hypothetical protein
MPKIEAFQKYTNEADLKSHQKRRYKIQLLDY